MQDFNLRARALFDGPELACNGFESEDRRGFKTFFPLTTIAAGVVQITDGQFMSPEEVASAAAVAKKAATKKAAVKKAFENQLAGKGFSFVEFVSNCPTNWGMTPGQSLDHIHNTILTEFPLGEFRRK